MRKTKDQPGPILWGALIAAALAALGTVATVMGSPTTWMVFVLAFLVFVGAGVMLTQQLRAASRRSTLIHAYIALHVTPAKSGSVLQSPALKTVATSAMAVWGQWDVMCTVVVDSFSELESAIATIQSLPDVDHTETFIGRDGQRYEPDGATTGDGTAIVLCRLTSKGRKIPETLELIRSHDGFKGKLVEGLGVIGRYDLLVRFHYSNDLELSNLIMNHLQKEVLGGRNPEATETLIAVADLKWP